MKLGERRKGFSLAHEGQMVEIIYGGVNGILNVVQFQLPLMPLNLKVIDATAEAGWTKESPKEVLLSHPGVVMIQ